MNDASETVWRHVNSLWLWGFGALTPCPATALGARHGRCMARRQWHPSSAPRPVADRRRSASTLIALTRPGGPTLTASLEHLDDAVLGRCTAIAQGRVRSIGSSQDRASSRWTRALVGFGAAPRQLPANTRESPPHHPSQLRADLISTLPNPCTRCCARLRRATVSDALELDQAGAPAASELARRTRAASDLLVRCHELGAKVLVVGGDADGATSG
jgi:hypothetical protein